ncbi:MAG: beta-Ala-His dipeptidase [Motiliproteus sp.]
MLNQLHPQLLWRHFEQICAVPHPSYHEAALIKVIEDFADSQGLQHLRDRVGNLIIRKPATPGHEQAPGIVLQSHLDMVPQKSDDSDHDFTRDPIRPRIIDGWVLATDTTLGADNGIGVAAILAVLEADDLEHGPLEALLTVNEESGMDGARGLEPGLLNGSLLLNLDSEQEAELYVGCAGGIDATAEITLSRSPINDITAKKTAETTTETTAETTSENITVKLIVRGLQGGHSGLDINLGRGNANQLLAQLLQQLESELQLALIDFDGGSLRNAIPRRAEALIQTSAPIDVIRNAVARFKATLQQQYSQSEPQLEIGVLQTETHLTPLNTASQQQLLAAILQCPHGMTRMHPQLDGVVETSNNLARVLITDNRAQLQCLARSADEGQREALCRQIETALAPMSATVSFDGAYPGWTPDLQSPLLQAMQQQHQQLFGQQADIKVIHAGLECGLLAAAYPNWQMISFGPTICFPHSPAEKVEIASVERFWRYLTTSLKQLAL